MSSTDIKPLIHDTISRHCQDDRVENAIIDVLREVMARQYYNIDDTKSFKRRYTEIILANFTEELEDE